MTKDRRHFLKSSAMTAITCPFFSSITWAAPTPADEPHFFLHFVPESLTGFDPLYMFDPRDKSLAKEGKVTAYSKLEPFPWQKKGPLVAGETAVLAPYAADFSVIRGVIMSPSFDGHGQNKSMIFTGNPFSGRYFAPAFSGRGSPLSYLNFSPSLQGFINNRQNAPAIDALYLNQILPTLASEANSNNQRERKFIHDQFASASQMNPAGLFSKGAEKFLHSLETSQILTARAQRFQEPRATFDLLLNRVSTAIAAFKAGITRAAVIEIPVDTSSFSADCHDGKSASKHPEHCESMLAAMANAIRVLKNTPFSDDQSMLDCTTFIMMSEFGRTMRQEQFAIDQTGTDHNTLNNQVIIGGKGIKGGQIIGSSDLHDLADFKNASRHHLQLDADLIKTMGRPYDFANGQTLHAGALDQSSFNLKNYLSVQSVMNTVMRALNISRDYYHKESAASGAKPFLIIENLLR